MDEYIARKEHEEFCKRMAAENKRLEDENDRQNHRISELEEEVKYFTALAGSVEKLAMNMENMLKEQEKQGERLKTLEGRDGEMWRKVTAHIITVILGIVVGCIFTQIGF